MTDEITFGNDNIGSDSAGHCVQGKVLMVNRMGTRRMEWVCVDREGALRSVGDMEWIWSAD